MNSHIRFYILFAVVLATKTVHACDEFREDRDRLGMKIFSLSIDRSFHQEVIFQLWENCDLKTLRVRVGSNKQEMELDRDSHQRIVRKFARAQESNVKDLLVGVDGSMWCLDNYEFENSELPMVGTISCFWSPTSDAESRKLKGLSELGQYLWSIPSMKLLEGELY